jgi:hypothetical protein
MLFFGGALHSNPGNRASRPEQLGYFLPSTHSLRDYGIILHFDIDFHQIR